MGAVAAGASRLFLFRFTYLYVAMNNAFQLGRHGPWVVLLFVAITACVYSYWNFANYSALKSGDPGVGDLVGVLWATWAVLWLLFCLVGALVKARLTRLTGGVVRGTGNLFGLVPALTLVNIPSAVSSALAIVIAIVSVATFIVFLVLTKPKWSVTEGGATGPIASPTAYAPAPPA